MLGLLEQCKPMEEQMLLERPLHLRSVLRGKRFHEALKAIDYKDASVAEEAQVRFPLVGWMKCSGVFAANLRPPALHVSAFETMAAAHSARTIAGVKPTMDALLRALLRWTSCPRDT